MFVLLSALSCTLITPDELAALWSEGGWVETDSGWARSPDSVADSSAQRSDSLPPADSSPCVVEPELDDMLPRYGSDAGGDTLVLYGAHFDGSTTVEFDGIPAASVLLVDSERLRVTTPAVLSAEPVDVEVKNPCGEAALEDGFRYFSDASGRATAWGSIEFIDHRGGYWSSALEDSGRFWWTLNMPDDHHYWERYGGDESCELNAAQPELLVLDDAGGDAQVQVGSEDPIDTPWQGSDLVWYGEFERGQWADDAAIALLPIDDEGSGFHGLEFLMARTPSSLVVSSPEMAGDSPPTLGRDQMDFSWEPVTADRIVLQLGRAPDGTNITDIVSCVALNDGHFEVPAEVWGSPWSSGEVIYVLVSALREEGGVVPVNRGESRIVGMMTVMGAILPVAG